MDTPVQQQVQHWQRIRREADINLLILDSRAKPVNPLLGALDERFRWDASKKLQTHSRQRLNIIGVDSSPRPTGRQSRLYTTPGYAERSPPGTFAFNERKNKRIEYTFPGCGAPYFVHFIFGLSIDQQVFLWLESSYQNIDRLKKAPPSQPKCDTVHPLHVCSTRSKQASQMRLVWGFLSSARSRRSQVERKIVQGENTSDRCGFSTYRSESAGSDRGFTLWTG